MSNNTLKNNTQKTTNSENWRIFKRGKFVLNGLEKSIAALSILAISTSSFAQLPTGGAVQSGTVSFSSPSGTQLNVDQTSATGIINWNIFDIGAGNSVQFNNGTGSTLNRVVTNDPSDIYGNLSSTGSVYLINKNGITVGNTGQVTTGGSFIASTLDVTNADYLDAGDLTFNGTGGVIVNQGSITTTNGDIFIFAEQVNNSGTIDANSTASLNTSTAGVGAGHRIVLKNPSSTSTATTLDKFAVEPSLGQGQIINSGTIDGLRTEIEARGGNIYSLAINNTGTIRASDIVNTQGNRLVLLAHGSNIKSTGNLITSSATNNTRNSLSVVADAGDIELGGNVISGQGGFGGAVNIIAKGDVVINNGANISADQDNSTLTIYAGTDSTYNPTTGALNYDAIDWYNSEGVIDFKGNATLSGKSFVLASGIYFEDTDGSGNVMSASDPDDLYDRYDIGKNVSFVTKAASSVFGDFKLYGFGDVDVNFNSNSTLQANNIDIYSTNINIDENIEVRSASATTGNLNLIAASFENNYKEYFSSNYIGRNNIPQIGTVNFAGGTNIALGNGDTTINSGSKQDIVGGLPVYSRVDLTNADATFSYFDPTNKIGNLVIAGFDNFDVTMPGNKIDSRASVDFRNVYNNITYDIYAGSSISIFSGYFKNDTVASPNGAVNQTGVTTFDNTLKGSELVLSANNILDVYSGLDTSLNRTSFTDSSLGLRSDNVRIEHNNFGSQSKLQVRIYGFEDISLNYEGGQDIDVRNILVGAAGNITIDENISADSYLHLWAGLDTNTSTGTISTSGVSILPSSSGALYVPNGTNLAAGTSLWLNSGKDSLGDRPDLDINVEYTNPDNKLSSYLRINGFDDVTLSSSTGKIEADGDIVINSTAGSSPAQDITYGATGTRHLVINGDLISNTGNIGLTVNDIKVNGSSTIAGYDDAVVKAAGGKLALNLRHAGGETTSLNTEVATLDLYSMTSTYLTGSKLSIVEKDDLDIVTAALSNVGSYDIRAGGDIRLTSSTFTTDGDISLISDYEGVNSQFGITSGNDGYGAVFAEGAITRLVPNFVRAKVFTINADNPTAAGYIPPMYAGTFTPDPGWNAAFNQYTVHPNSPTNVKAAFAIGTVITNGELTTLSAAGFSAVLLDSSGQDVYVVRGYSTTTSPTINGYSSIGLGTGASVNYNGNTISYNPTQASSYYINGSTSGSPYASYTGSTGTAVAPTTIDSATTQVDASLDADGNPVQNGFVLGMSNQFYVASGTQNTPSAWSLFPGSITKIDGNNVTIQSGIMYNGNYSANGLPVSPTNPAVISHGQAADATITNIAGVNTGLGNFTGATSGIQVNADNNAVVAGYRDIYVQQSGALGAAAGSFNGNLTLMAGRDLVVSDFATMKAGKNLFLGAGNVIKTNPGITVKADNLAVFSGGGTDLDITSVSGGDVNLTVGFLDQFSGWNTQPILQGGIAPTYNINIDSNTNVNITDYVDNTLGAEISLGNQGVAFDYAAANLAGEVTYEGVTSTSTKAGTGNVTINATGDIYGNANMSTVEGNITLNATNNVEINKNYVSTGGGDLTANATNDVINIGNLDSQSSGNITLSAGNDATSSVGTISGNSGNITVEALGNVNNSSSISNNSGSIALTAGGTNGTSASPIVGGGNIVNSGVISNGSGNVTLDAFLENTNSGAITTASGDVLLDGTNVTNNSAIASTDGDITLRGDQNVTNTASITNANGNVSLLAYYAPSTGIPVAGTGSVNNTGAINATGAGSVVLSGIDVFSAATIASNSGNITLDAEGNATVDANITSQGGNVAITAGGTDGTTASPFVGGGNITNNANVSTTGAGSVTLDAFNDVTTAAGSSISAEAGAVLVDGTNINNNSNITTTSGNVTVRADQNVTNSGAINTTDGNVALLANYAPSTGIPVAGTGSVNNTGAINATGAGSVTLSGIDVNSAATIASNSGNITLDAEGNATVDANITSQGGNVAITAGGTDGTSASSVVGGGNITNNANVSTTGAGTVTVDAYVNNNNNGSISAEAGAVLVDGTTINNAGTIAATTGSVTSRAEQDNNNTGTITTTSGAIALSAGDSSATGIPVAGTYALNTGNISTTSGNVSLNASGDVNLTDNVATTGIVNVNAGEDINQVNPASSVTTSNLTLVAGGNIGASGNSVVVDAGILSFSSGGTTDISAVNDVRVVNSDSVGDVNLDAGGNVELAADPLDAITTTANINVDAGGNISLTSNLTAAGISLNAGDSIVVENAYTLTADAIDLTAANDISGTSVGDAVNTNTAQIFAYSSAGGEVDVANNNAGPVTVTGFGSNGGDATFTQTGGADVTVNNSGFTGGQVSGAGGDLTIDVQGGDLTVAETVEGNNITYKADNIALQNDNNATGDFLAYSLGNVDLVGANINANNATIVADEATPLAVGTGAFNMDGSSSITAGNVAIFTASQSQNNIDAGATINGATYTAGIEFLDSTTEDWNTFYSTGGTASSPFTVFYKEDGVPVIPPAPPAPPAAPVVTVAATQSSCDTDASSGGCEDSNNQITNTTEYRVRYAESENNGNVLASASSSEVVSTSFYTINQENYVSSPLYTVPERLGSFLVAMPLTAVETLIEGVGTVGGGVARGVGGVVGGAANAVGGAVGAVGNAIGGGNTGAANNNTGNNN
jgi:hypothetical protein